MDRICVIPARGGSRRIPRKNIRMFHGKEMLRYAIDAAHESRLFSRIIVSTDDEEICAVAKRHGAEIPFTRPPEISDDYSTTLQVVNHAIETALPQIASLDQICCIYPCVPFLRPHHLIESSKLIVEGAFIFPVISSIQPYYRALKFENEKVVSPIWPDFANTRTQDIENVCYDAGQFYWATCKTWRSQTSIHSKAIGYFCKKHQFIDIDTFADWNAAENLYKARKSD